MHTHTLEVEAVPQKENLETNGMVIKKKHTKWDKLSWVQSTQCSQPVFLRSRAPPKLLGGSCPYCAKLCIYSNMVRSIQEPVLQRSSAVSSGEVLKVHILLCENRKHVAFQTHPLQQCYVDAPQYKRLCSCM